MRTSDLDYDLDPARIATEPAWPRDMARLLVYVRATGAIEHRRVRDLPDYLGPNDTMVVNETAVAPARIKAMRRADAGGSARIEGLLLERVGLREWHALLKNARRVKDGETLALVGPQGVDEAATLRVVGRDGDGWRVALDGPETAEAILDRVGWTPLPPYILHERKVHGEAESADVDAHDRAEYQTVYAKRDDRPSVAAPTAGLHFTDELLATLAARGVERVPVTLQVGAGTFKPVETDSLDEHPMHGEWCVVRLPALARLHVARATGRRIVAIGTTSVRTLESLPVALGKTEGGVAADEGQGEPIVWSTDLLIRPGYRFRHVEALLTNFHLPRSTLLALVAALTGLDELKRIYRVAIDEEYRFYSYGDAMLVV